MGDGIEEYRKRMEEKFKQNNQENSNKGMFSSLYPKKENKPDNRAPNDQNNNVDPDYEYARRVQQMMDNEEHEVYDMRNIDENANRNKDNKIQRQKSGPRQDPIEMSDMSRNDKGNRTPLIGRGPGQQPEDSRIGFDDYGNSHQNKEGFMDMAKAKFNDIWEEMSQQGKCSALTTCFCCLLILMVLFSSF